MNEATSIGLENTYLGAYTGSSASTIGSRNIIIGAYAGRDETGSDTLMIDNRDRTSEALGRNGSIIYGQMNANPENQNITFNANGKFVGDLNVTGKIHNSLSHMHGLATEVFSVASGGVWYNITMNASVSEYTSDTLSFHEDNITLELGHDGHYTVTFGMGIQDSSASPDGNIGMRITINDLELRGSYVEADTHKKDSDVWVEHTTHFEGNAGDLLRFEYIADDTTITIQQDDTYATQGFSAYGYLQEVIV